MNETIDLKKPEQDQEAREAAAKDIVAGLGGNAASDSNGDPLVSVADSIESILASIVSDTPEDAPADAEAS